jgi:hypothetical protein
LAIAYFRFGSTSSDPLARAPLLEELLCRAGPVAAVDDWRVHATRLAAPGAVPPSVACALRTAALEAVPEPATLYVASPVHLVAGLHGVTLALDGLLDLADAELEQLTGDFNALFGVSGVRLVRAQGRRLLCCMEARPAPAATTDPERVLGADIREHLPAGAQGAGLRRLMSELEMWLHGHELNEARRARGQPEVSSLWLWGGAAADERLPPLDLWSHGDDPLFRRYSPQAHYPGPERSGVVVHSSAPGAAGWEEFARAWLAPALRDLRVGRLQRIELSAGAASRALGRAASFRVWRRPQPWWVAFEQPATPDGSAHRAGSAG